MIVGSLTRSRASGGRYWRFSAVFQNPVLTLPPGSIAVTLMPVSAHSRAIVSVSPYRPCLELTYGDQFGSPCFRTPT